MPKVFFYDEFDHVNVDGWILCGLASYSCVATSSRKESCQSLPRWMDDPLVYCVDWRSLADERTSGMATKTVTPWGWWKIIAKTPHWKIKELYVEQGKRTSLQFHQRRDEYWLVLSGKAQVRCGPFRRTLQPLSSLTIRRGITHRIGSATTGGVRILEIQIGECREEDIVRIKDDYRRR